jgi:ABC-type glutathione transport system ATPase component
MRQIEGFRKRGVQMPTDQVQVLLIAGRSGVGKTTVSYEVSALLRQGDISHVLIDGDNLDAVHPPVENSWLAETNLRAMWSNYRVLGHHRAIYVNTVSVLEEKMVRRALDGKVSVIGVLLTSNDATANGRLERREIGSTLEVHQERSAAASALLNAEAPQWVRRVPTDNQTVREIACEIVRLTGWLGAAD